MKQSLVGLSLLATLTACGTASIPDANKVTFTKKAEDIKQCTLIPNMTFSYRPAYGIPNDGPIKDATYTAGGDTVYLKNQILYSYTGYPYNCHRSDVVPTTPDPRCNSVSECKAMWEAAQAWVATSLPMKLQQVTDTVIFTYNSTNGSLDLGAQITKLPLGDGHYMIVSKFGCANAFGCNPTSAWAYDSFKKALTRFSQAPPVASPIQSSADQK